jgi:ribosomal protein L11 methyltransferase
VSWQQFFVETAAAQLAAVEQALIDCGALAVTLEDAGDAPILEPAPGAAPLWPRMRVRALFDESVSAELVSGKLGQALAGAGRLEPLAAQDWTRAWLAHARPLCFGTRLCIAPAGLAPPHWTAAVVELTPGLAFGTGSHPSTAACLEWLSTADLEGARVLDYGCGSGVLAIAALKLGARRATAVDIDPQARSACTDNAQRNGVAGRLCVRAPGELAACAYDVVLANILARPLVALAPLLTALVRAGGALVLAGMLEDQAAAVSRAYAADFDFAPPEGRGPWASLTGHRRPVAD